MRGARAQSLRAALGECGYTRRVSRYVHQRSPWPILLCETFPCIGAHPINEFVEVQTRQGNVATLPLTEAIAQRISAWINGDPSALTVGAALAAHRHTEVQWDRLRSYAEDLKRASSAAAARVDFALSEVGRLVRSHGGARDR